MTKRGLLARFAPVGLLPPAAFVVHELRYMLAFGGGAGAELQRTGHSYLHSVVPWLVLLLALIVGGFLRAIGRALSGQRSLPRYAVSVAGLWMLCATALVLIFACQEFLEGLFATGHPAGLAGIFGYGGWWSRGHLYPHQGVPEPAIGFLQECLRWWDYWLKGIETGIMDEPQLRVWMQESVAPRPFYAAMPGRWVAEPSWPSPHIADAALCPRPGDARRRRRGRGAPRLRGLGGARQRRRDLVPLRPRGGLAARPARRGRPLADLHLSRRSTRRWRSWGSRRSR